MKKEDWRPNPGVCPPRARGKRIRVKLEGGGGEEPLYADHWDKMAPPGWPADNSASKGGPGANWSLKNHPFAIKEYLVI